MKKIAKILGLVLFKIKKLVNYCVRVYLSSKFSKVGKDVYVGQGGIFTYENIENILVGMPVGCSCGVQ